MINISVVNTGTCEIVSLIGYFDVHNAETTQAWNFNSSIGEIYGFGTLSPGEISFHNFFSRGFVFSFGISAQFLKREIVYQANLA